MLKFLIKARNSHRTSFLLHLVQILYRFFFLGGGGLGRGSKGLRESSQVFFGRMVRMLDFIITKPRGQVFQ